MRRFEWILVFIAAFAVLWPVVFGVRPRRGIVAGVVLAGLIAHFRFEGFRWQMVPVYLFLLGLAVGDILFVDRTLRWTSRISRGVFGMAGLVFVSLLPVILPVPELPTPSGGNRIGTISVEVVDEEREEVFGEEPGGPRRLMTQVWYPADVVPGSSPVLWSEDWDVVAPAMSRRLGLPSWFLSHTGITTAHAVEQAPPASGSYPVVIYSHGWTGFRTVAVNQMETLASNGYIVIAIDHTYGSVVTRFPDGEVIGYDPEALPPESAVGRSAHLQAADHLIETFADDVVTVIDALELGAEGPYAFISGTADTSRIGVFGHSAGGGAAVRVCLVDERCHAVLAFDPWVEPLPDQILRETATRPALFMRSDKWRGTPNDSVLRGIVGRGDSITYWVGVEGAEHNDFVLTPFLSPFASQMGLKGPITSGRIVPIIDNYLVGFFDVFLLGTGSAALDTIRFHEVTVEVVDP